MTTPHDLQPTTDALRVDPPPTCSAFWQSVAATAAVIIETLPKCGSSSLVNESQSLRKELGRLVGIMERSSIPMAVISQQNVDMEAQNL